ncbi:hypothetical protein XENOCAPTIV_006110 [Xenoophorus captivus]|uniref:Uncharacterized protein n=1 Tax=Xenoophorus captivus TaxID=1517983 RepID=A0ABV0R366_9TELE
MSGLPDEKYLAAADPGAFLAPLHGLLLRRHSELQPGIDRCEPEAVLVGKVVAGALGSVALDEWGCSEVFQAGSGRHQGLTAALSAGCCVLWWEGRDIYKQK